ncbi:MAG: DUF6522 family protein [Roseitalea porphyridii]|uniref:DUF6522 family protein n=1 Tax=Roseitalea porphyridii TaxID=1852022 RepID=UPI0032D99933
MTVEIEQGTVTVSADMLAGPLGIEPDEVQPLMRKGAITGLVEEGVGEDGGRYRLTFRHGGRRLQLICDEDGHVLQRSRTVLVGRTSVLP